MATLYTQRTNNIRKTWFFMTMFFIFIIVVGWVFSYVLESPVILYIAVFISIFMNIWAYWFSDKMVIAMTRAKEVAFDANPELHRIVENLAITAGLPKPRIYIVNEPQPNAFATGRNPEKAIVAVTEGLLRRLDRSELEGVLAHEMAHIGNRDMLISTVAVVLAGVIAILADIFMRMTFWGVGGRRGGSRDPRAGIIVFLIGIAAAILAPIAASMIRLAISRKREFLADATGALMTRYPEGLASALKKISSDPTPMKVASDATAHLFFSNPFKGKQKRKWLVKLFMTHPPVEERITVLRSMDV
jgi:heat shock protein HtpX